jgi:predicted AAA+ superfamily ATPase
MERYNPWWLGEEDEDYKTWSEKKIKWIPKLVSEISIQPYSLHFLVGPRQVGKT